MSRERIAQALAAEGIPVSQEWPDGKWAHSPYYIAANNDTVGMRVSLSRAQRMWEADGKPTQRAENGGWE
jgi:hypothetical protein